MYCLLKWTVEGTIISGYNELLMLENEQDNLRKRLIAYTFTYERLIKSLPYLAAIIIGLFLYFIAVGVGQKYRDLLINISAAFIAIPFLYLFYETVQSFSHKKLNKEIFDYAKMQIDRELLSILNQLQKIVYTLEKKDFSDIAISRFLSLKKEQIENYLKENKYLGFQVFKNWKISERDLHELLKNPYILGKLEDRQIISIIKVVKSLRALEEIQKIDVLYTETEQKAKEYKVLSGVEMNSINNQFPDRHLLLKYLSEDKFVVYDFGDIPKYNLEKCLTYYEINHKLVKLYAEVIFELLSNINCWLNATGSEFVIDTKMFRTRGKFIA